MRLNNFEDSFQNLVARGLMGGQSVEDGRQDAQSEPDAIVRGGCDGFGDIFADLRQVVVRLCGLVDEVYDKIVGGEDF